MIGHAARTLTARNLNLPPNHIKATWDALYTEGTLAYAPTPDQFTEWAARTATELTDHPAIVNELERATMLALVGIVPDAAEWHATRHLTRCAPFHTNPAVLNLPTGRPLRIGVDMDDVIYNWTDMIREWVATQIGMNPARFLVKEHYDFFEGWAGMTASEVMNIYGKAIDARVAYTTGKIRPGAKQAFDAIKAAGHNIVIITARTTGPVEQVTEDTLAWLEQEDMIPDEFHVEANKTTIDVDVMCDDSTRNGQAALDAGTEALLFSHVFNHDVSPEMDARRVYTWEQALDRLGIAPAVNMTTTTQAA